MYRYLPIFSVNEETNFQFENVPLPPIFKILYIA